MYRAQETIGARAIEREREAVVRIQRVRAEQAGGADDRVRLAITVDPGHPRVGLYLQGSRLKHEVLQHDLRIRARGARHGWLRDRRIVQSEHAAGLEER